MRAVCPGTFDPATSGHIDIIERASRIFNEVIVAVSHSPRKKPLFDVETRIDFLRSATSRFSNVSVDSFDGLLVDFCNKNEAKIIIKGLRAISDFENEFMMAQMNSRLEKGIETIFMMASPEYSYLSSSVVKEISGYGGTVTGLVPASVEEKLSGK